MVKGTCWQAKQSVTVGKGALCIGSAMEQSRPKVVEGSSGVTGPRGIAEVRFQGIASAEDYLGS